MKKPSRYASKAPFRYSTLYNSWRAAVLANRKDDADRLGREHTERVLAGQARAE